MGIALERVNHILERWSREGVEAALEDDATLPSPDELAPALSALPRDERRVLLNRLDDFGRAIEAYRQELVSNMAVTETELKRASTMENAMLSYTARDKTKG
jgi:hypothetical protein